MRLDVFAKTSIEVCVDVTYSRRCSMYSDWISMHERGYSGGITEDEEYGFVVTTR